jgi:hypothetical protein
MALQQLELCSQALAEGSGALLAVRCNYGTAILPSLFGAERFLMERELDTLPACRPLGGGADAVRRVLDRGVPDAKAGQGGVTLGMGQYYRDLFRHCPKLARHVYIYHPDLQGPLNVCEMLWGGSFYVDLYDRPGLVRDFLALIAETYVHFMRRWDEIVATKDKAGMASPHDYAVHWSMLHRGRIMLRDDAATNLSPAMFDEFVRPCDQRLLAELGGGALHFCGRGDHFIAQASQMSGVHAVNTTQPALNEVETILCHTVDKGVNLLGFERAVAEQMLAQGRDLRGRVHCW